ncbi:TPA: hypothetical protein ACNOH1_003753, partial [Providencia rettgeri]
TYILHLFDINVVLVLYFLTQGGFFAVFTTQTLSLFYPRRTYFSLVFQRDIKTLKTYLLRKQRLF